MKTSNALLLGAALSTALLTGCYEETTPNTDLATGTYTVAFEGARYQVIEGEGEAVESTVDVPFEVEGQAYFLTIEDSSDYCFLEGGTEPSSTYSILCGYIGPAFSLSFDSGQLYEGHPQGTIIGPGTEVELWGQFAPQFETTKQVEAPVVEEATPSPSPTEEASRWIADEDPTPGEDASGETITAICTQTIAHSFYGHLEARDSFTGLLTIIDTTVCIDEEGETIPSAYRRVVFEGEGLFTQVN